MATPGSVNGNLRTTPIIESLLSGIRCTRLAAAHAAFPEPASNRTTAMRLPGDRLRNREPDRNARPAARTAKPVCTLCVRNQADPLASNALNH
jgi:hypothetical protein